MVLLVIMMVFFFLYVGLEVAFGTFITTFAVTSKLGRTITMPFNVLHIVMIIGQKNLLVLILVNFTLRSQCHVLL